MPKLWPMDTVIDGAASCQHVIVSMNAAMNTFILGVEELRQRTLSLGRRFSCEEHGALDQVKLIADGKDEQDGGKYRFSFDDLRQRAKRKKKAQICLLKLHWIGLCCDWRNATSEVGSLQAQR